jgi:uncharacterized protein YycO
MTKMKHNYRHFILFTIPLLLMGCSTQQALVSKKESKITSDNPCWQQTLDTYGTTTENRTRVLNQEIEEYQSLVEQSLSYRAAMIEVAQRLKENMAQDQPLSGQDLDILNRGMIIYLEHRQKLLAIAKAHECWLDIPIQKFKQWKVEPISPKNQLLGIMLSLSAALVLYDNYLLGISIFEEDGKLRRIINEHDPGYAIGRNQLAELTQSYNSISNRQRVRAGLEFYDRQSQQVSQTLQRDKNFNYLKVLIEQSPSYNMTKTYSPLYVIGRKLKFMGAFTTDILYELAQEGLNLFSALFGNTLGLVELRKGKLYDRVEVYNLIMSQIKAGDILLEKTPFRLTDQFIPGHWGHAAIWIGTEAELKALGIWEHPIVRFYHQKIKKGHSVVEALRPGVQMNSLPYFLNIDDLAILRRPDLDKAALAKRIILALRQVGKEYDFNFDVETTDRIVCSELIYVVYTGIKWPTEKTLGRFTISPDNVASKALNDGPLQLIMLFHDSQLVTRNPLQLMRLLIEGK